MNKIVKILMERDGISREEAEALVRETRDEIMCTSNIFEIHDIISDYLGLEPDYLEDIISV